jgi:DNA-binding CsgD family transcriptional regulator
MGKADKISTFLGEGTEFEGKLKFSGKNAEEGLRGARDKLERVTEERTSDLLNLNEQLRKEIEERKEAEAKLKVREKELKIKSSNLEEANIALKVLLQKRNEDRVYLEEKILLNIKWLILPYLEKLKKSGLDKRQEVYRGIIETFLNDIISPFTRRLSSPHLNLTPTEIQVATFVREGKTTKEVAGLLNSSARAVCFHRENLRRKLGLKNQKTNLRSYLLSQI